MKKILWTLSILAALLFSCSGNQNGEPGRSGSDTIELQAPADNSVCAIVAQDPVSFSWNTVDAVRYYKLLLSRDKNLSSPKAFTDVSSPKKMTGYEFDALMEEMGVAKGQTVDLYWSVVPNASDAQVETQVRKMTVTRLDDPEKFIPENADPIVIKVAVLYEDMVVESEGKRLHECCNWYDPHVQVQQMVRYMTDCSHGVVQYQIAVEIESDRSYGYYTKTHTPVTADDCFHKMFPERKYPGLGEGVAYDYTTMVTANGFDKMSNNHEIDEVWIYSFPGNGSFEDCMAGPGAFWINGDVFSVPGLQRKLSVLFCNYERTVDLAMHSYMHRFENVMKEVYGRWDYNVSLEKDLNNWERFSAYQKVYDKYDKGMSQIGNCHFPCNGEFDYDYESDKYVMSYCDNWDYYPNLKLKSPRRLSSGEWSSSQMGYMKWFYLHVPHFKGLNTDPSDGHLNNWWYYLVDYDGAMQYEKSLKGN